MNDESLRQLVLLVIGGGLGVLFKYWYDYKGMVYKELWIKRYSTYKKMFSIAGNFPLYPATAVISYHALLKNSEEMRDWFFKEGGLLLSIKTRKKYFKVQEEVQEILKKKANTHSEQIIEKAEYESVRTRFGKFRRAMTDDLMSRSRV